MRSGDGSKRVRLPLDLHRRPSTCSYGRLWGSVFRASGRLSGVLRLEAAEGSPEALVMPISPSMRSRYPDDWALRSRFIREYRSRGRCEWCGAANGEPHPVTGSRVVLTAAHVHDRRPEAASLLNLAALCQRCHNAHDQDQRRASRGLPLVPKRPGRQGKLAL